MVNNKIEVLDRGNSEDILVEKLEEADGITIYRIKVKYEYPVYPQRLSLSFAADGTDVFSVWSPTHTDERSIKPNWCPNISVSRACDGAPIQTALSHSGKNRLTVALSDPKTPLELKMGIRENDVRLVAMIDIFTLPVAKIDYYEADLRIDTRPVEFYDAIKEVRTWWNGYGYKNAKVPEAAKIPVYSTWYSFHQHFDSDAIIKECEASKEYGCETVILDDGWQTEDYSSGYAFCGDWEACAAKVGDIAELAERIHALDMKLILWFSVPYVGKNSKAWERFKECFLNDPQKGEWHCLDPRFPKVREYLIKLYSKAAKEWKLDGFKLDFIDSFTLTDYSISRIGCGRDVDSIEDAVEILLRDIMKSLKKINPDICIEFRQKYIGPLMQTYGNMLRVSDCPADSLKNRVGMVDLRLLSGATAVHSDMLEWNYTDTPENAATQFVNVLYAVPQISVISEKLKPEHKRVLNFYSNFWKEHKNILIGGEFKAFAPWANYSAVSAEKDGTIIYTAYESRVAEIGSPFEKLVLINGTGKNGLVLDYSSIESITGRNCIIYDCTGRERYTYNLVQEELRYIPVPNMGMAVIE